MPSIKIIFCIFLSLAIINCGGGGGGSSTTSDDDDTSDTVNTAKLVGTPFEGLETGDDLWPPDFYCGDYRTETIDVFPIQVFVAFFTEGEEEAIQEGIDIANDGIGFEAYELTDTWADDVRVIYKVDEVQSGDGPVQTDAGGQAKRVLYYFNDHTFSERLITDWVIELRSDSINELTTAHELGHATGLDHCLIDYDDGISCDSDALEENSIMNGSVLGSALNDYNMMMAIQGQIMLDHVDGNDGVLDTGECAD